MAAFKAVSFGTALLLVYMISFLLSHVWPGVPVSGRKKSRFLMAAYFIWLDIGCV